jgi:hypothetical protein
MTTVTIPIACAQKTVISIEPEKHSADNELKYKLRDLNLIMYNPNHFRNRGKGDFYEMIGGDRTSITIVGFAILGKVYRAISNQNNGIRKTYGGWGRNITSLAGAGMGLVFSLIFFANTQQIFNDYTAVSLMKRYPGCMTLERKDIWLQRHKQNNDDHYYFTSSYMNTYHM